MKTVKITIGPPNYQGRPCLQATVIRAFILCGVDPCHVIGGRKRSPSMTPWLRIWRWSIFIFYS